MPPRHRQFLVAGAAHVLRAVVELVEADPEADVLSVVTTGRADPERLVVTMDPAQADALRAAFGRVLVVEPDEPLPEPSPGVAPRPPGSDLPLPWPADPGGTP